MSWRDTNRAADAAFTVPWGAWHGDTRRGFRLPDGFDVEVCTMRGGTRLGKEALQEALDRPVETPPLAEVARGRRNAVIAVEDLTRPARLDAVLPTILTALENSGIASRDIRIVIGVGAHAPMNRDELIKKLGRDVVRRYDVFNHHPYEDLVDLGVSERGVPIHINRHFAEADLKMAVGSVVPHPYAGFSGGAKIVLPGVAGIETLEANHRPVVTGVVGGLGQMEGNTARQEMESIALLVGLEFIVNVVTDDERQPVGIFAGHPVAAHRAAVVCARRTYATPPPPWVPDIAILNAFPKDTEMLQVGNVFNVLRSAGDPLPVRENGVIIVLAACSTGRGHHSLHGRDMRLYRPPTRKNYLGSRQVIIHSPDVSEADVRVSFHEGYPFEPTWEGVVQRLGERYRGGTTRVAVYPCAPIQLLETR